MNNPARRFIFVGLLLFAGFSTLAKGTELKINFQGARVPFADPDLLLVRGPNQHQITVAVRFRPISGNISELTLTLNGRRVPTTYNPVTRLATGRIMDGNFNWDAKRSNTLVAEATAGRSRFISNELTVVAMPFPQWLGQMISFGSLRTATISTWRIGLDSREFTRDIKGFGEFGLSFSLNGELEVDTENFEYGAELAGGAELKHDGSGTSLSLGGSGSGAVVQSSAGQPFRFTAEQWTVFLELSKTFVLAKKSMLDIIKPGATTAINEIPFIGPRIVRVISKISISLTAAPSMRGSLVVEPDNTPQIVSGLVSGDLDVRATLKARLRTPGFGKVGATAFVGGKPNFEIQTVAPVFRQLGFRAFAGTSFHFGPWTTEFNHTFVNFQTGPRRQHPPVQGVLSDNDGNNWGLQVEPGRTRFPIAENSQIPFLRRFVELTNRTSPNRPRPGNFRRNSAVVTLARNSSPLSHPAVAARGDDLMVLLAEDSRPEGAETSPCQFTRMVFTRFNGKTWSAPRRITPPGSRTDGAQIDPSVCYDGSGRVIAAWQQMDDPSFNTNDPGEYLRHNDIYASIYAGAGGGGATGDTPGRWGRPFFFGAEGRADLQPYVKGPLTNGDAILFWQRSDTPSFYSTRSLRTINTEFRMVAWDNRTSRWVQEQAVMPASENVVGFDFDAKNDLGILVLNVDRGGRGLDSDHDLQINRYNPASRTWSGVSWLTNDSAYDTNPSVLVSESNEVFVVWNRDGNLVVDRNLRNRPKVLRRASEGTEITEIYLQDLTRGRVSVSWSENTTLGATVMTMIYDPRTKSWGMNSLNPSLPVKTVYDVVSDRAGNLVTLFTETKLDVQTVRAPGEGNKPVVVEGVPILGKQSIKVGKYSPTSNLVMTRLSTSTNRIEPGRTITIRAQIEDRGLLGERNTRVRFYLGDPRAGGRLLSNQRTAIIRGGETIHPGFRYTVPNPISDQPIYAQLNNDPNQIKLLYLGGRFVTSTEVASVVRPDGSGYVDAVIANDGSQATGLFRVDLVTTDRNIASKRMTSIASGGSVRIRLNFPRNAVPPEGRTFRIVNQISGPVIGIENDSVFLRPPRN